MKSNECERKPEENRAAWNETTTTLEGREIRAVAGVGSAFEGTIVAIDLT